MLQAQEAIEDAPNLMTALRRNLADLPNPPTIQRTIAERNNPDMIIVDFMPRTSYNRS